MIATVNGEAIHFEDLERLLGDVHRGAADTERGAPDLDRAVHRLVNDTLLAQEARALGMHEEEPIPSRIEARREAMAVARLEREEVRSRAEPGEEEIEAAYREEYRRISFRMITAYEREEAEALRERLEAGEDFEALAREHSVDPYAPRGGLVEDLPRIDVPHELAEDAFAVEPGERLGPLSTRIGWAVIRVESFADADPERFEALRDSVASLVRYRKAEALRGDLVPRLREAHAVEVDEAALASIGAERLPDGRLIPKLARPDAAVARIGDRTITAERLGQALRLRWKGIRNEQVALTAKSIVLQRMVREELMRAEALARGYGETPEVERALSAYETRLLVPRFLKEVIAPGVEVTAEEMRRYYEENREHLHRPPRLLLRQLTVASEAEAERLAGLIRQGADLAWLARQHSVDRFREAGGERGWVVAGRERGPFAETLFQAQAGDVLGPAAVPEGFAVVRVAAREEQGIYPFEEISGNIRKAVATGKSQRAIHDFLELARSRSEIVVHEDVLEALRITGTREEEGEAAAPHPGPGTHPPEAQP